MNYTHTFTSKGQITVPKPLREALGLKPGDRATFRLTDRQTIEITRPKTIEEIHAILGKPTFSDPLTEKEKMVLAGMKKDGHKAFR